MQPPMVPPRTAIWTAIERLAWLGGLIGLAVWLIIAVAGRVGMRHEMDRFAAVRASEARRRALAIPPGLAALSDPDQRLWSPQRVRAWREARTEQAPAPLAVLRIPDLGLAVPVLEGTDDWTLNRAAGHIADTALPGADGNSGIAGHRDGFFRVLKDVRAGDTLELETPATVEVYRIERSWIVDPEDVSVLDETPSRTVTLVTCYPFYFVGSAPQRYVVRAVLTESR